MGMGVSPSNNQSAASDVGSCEWYAGGEFSETPTVYAFGGIGDSSGKADSWIGRYRGNVMSDTEFVDGSPVVLGESDFYGVYHSATPDGTTVNICSASLQSASEIMQMGVESKPIWMVSGGRQMPATAELQILGNVITLSAKSDGTVTLNIGLRKQANVKIDGNLVVMGDLDIKGKLGVTGDTTIKGNLDVMGATSIKQTLRVTQMLTADAGITCQNGNITAMSGNVMCQSLTAQSSIQAQSITAQSISAMGEIVASSMQSMSIETLTLTAPTASIATLRYGVLIPGV
jgi:hypothetical protein